MPDGADNRRYPRRKLTLAVGYRTTGSFLVAYSVNLSKGGIFIEAPPLPVGTPVQLQIDVPGVESEGGGTKRIAIDGVVAWVRSAAGDGMPAGMGVRFSALLEDTLGKHIDSLAAGFSGLDLLVVAGTPERRALLERWLQTMLSCNCLAVEERAMAEMSLAAGVDLVVIDLDTGGVDGMEVLRLAESTEHPPPVIVLANEPDVVAWARGRAGATVLPSPPTFANLHTAAIQALARPRVK